jgi:2-C-methyl-D-erythritol 4-phosphate cytidylyltransferase
MTFNDLPEFSLIIPAAGSGQRFGGVKKQFEALAGMSLLQRTLRTFLALTATRTIVVCVPATELSARRAEIKNPGVRVVIGGDSRPASVRKGLAALGELKDDAIILIHDAVRPLCTQDLVTRIVQATATHGAAIPALPVTDTIKEVDEQNFVIKTLPRKRLQSVQTPQGFKACILHAAYRRFPSDDADFTDEAALVEGAGFKVATVAGESSNLKITTPFDLDVAELLLRQGML